MAKVGFRGGGGVEASNWWTHYLTVATRQKIYVEMG